MELYFFSLRNKTNKGRKKQSIKKGLEMNHRYF